MRDMYRHHHRTTNDQLCPAYQYAHNEKERFNGLQPKLQEINVCNQPSIDLFRTITPSSRDSGIPILSSATSSCSSSTFERASPATSSLQEERVLEFFLPSPTKTSRRLSYPLNESHPSMSCIYDSASHHSSPRRSVHWNDESILFSRERNDDNHFDIPDVKKCGRHVLLNTSLPFYSKLNIRIRTHRDEFNDNDRVKATARIQRLDAQDNHAHDHSLRKAYGNHYATISPQENMNTTTTATRTQSPIQYNRLPPHRQVSLPIALPINQQLVLYIRNGEVFARC